MDPDRERFYRETQARLDELSRQIAELKQQSREASRDRQGQYQDTIDRLQKREVDLRENLEQIKTAGKEAWADLKPRLKSALDDLTQGLGNAISEFKFSKPKAQPSE
jgi:predicted  nucleic acid-binding Zn-ribbon protein